MNFFKQLSETGLLKVEINLVVKDESMTAIITPHIKGKNPLPLTVTGTAEELDEGFFEVVTTPLKKAAGLISNVEEFEASLDETSTETKKAEEKTTATKEKAAAKATTKKAPVYKHQKYLDAILNIVNADGFVLNEENKDTLYAATSKLLVMDSKNEVALEWEKKIKELSGPIDEPKVVEEKEKPVPVEEKVVAEEKTEEPVKEESKSEEKIEKKPTPPPAPEKDEVSSNDDEDPFFDDDDLNMDFEDFFK